MEENPIASSASAEDGLDFKKLGPVLFIVLVDVLSLTIIIPILPFYAISFGASPFWIGFLGAVFPFMQFLFVPILGGLSDRLGRKPVLAAAQVGTFLSLLVLGFANGYWIIVLARALDGITGANVATAQAVITDSTTAENRAKGLGLIGATFGVGFVLGPALSGIALGLSGNNYAVPAFVAACFAFVSVLLTVFVLPETNPVERRTKTARDSAGRNFLRLFSAFFDSKVGVVLVLILFYQIVFGIFQLTFAPLTLNLLGFNSLSNAIFFTAFGVIIAIVQGGLVGPLTKRYGERIMVFTGLFLSAFSFLLGGFAPQMPAPWYSRDALIEEFSQQADDGLLSDGDLEAQYELLPPEGNQGWFGLIYLLIAIAPLPVGVSLFQPNTNSLLTRRSDPERAGEILGFGGSALAAGSVIGPLAGGYLFQEFGPNGVYLTCGVLLILLFGISLYYLKPLPQDSATAVVPEN